jgi:RHS repeat-associated protein
VSPTKISRTATVTDALQQTTDYTYNADNTLSTVSYNAQQSTPSVSFNYHPTYQRVVSMTDGMGTTTYSYYPVSSSPALGANLLMSVTSPVASTSNTDTIVYSYDALNRVIGLSVNGEPQSIGYDSIGRFVSVGNPLDAFSYSYSDGTPRVTAESSNNGPTSSITYFGPAGDELLQEINVATNGGGSSLSQFGYTYNADDNVTSYTVSVPAAQTTRYAYDTANRLLSGLFGTGSTPQFVYGYDNADDLTSITPNGTEEKFSYGPTNAIMSGTYDANGSPTALGGNTYTWDGANRLLTFANSVAGTSSTFTYDGLGRLVQVVDSTGSSTTANHSYTWCGSVRCLAHDNTQSGSPVSAQYFDQGIITGGTSYYYVQDGLGSVSQLVTASGAVASQYTYDPYGNRTTVSSTVTADVGYAGYFTHAASGMDFAMYRAYDPTHARWLNRDPIGEAGGLNMYGYVAGNPINETDPRGLQGGVEAEPPIEELPPTVRQYNGWTEPNPAVAAGIPSTLDAARFADSQAAVLDDLSRGSRRMQSTGDSFVEYVADSMAFWLLFAVQHRPVYGTNAPTSTASTPEVHDEWRLGQSVVATMDLCFREEMTFEEDAYGYYFATANEEIHLASNSCRLDRIPHTADWFFVRERGAT